MDAMTSSKLLMKSALRKDHRGVDLSSDVLPFGPLWYDRLEAVSKCFRLRAASQSLKRRCDSRLRYRNARARGRFQRMVSRFVWYHFKAAFPSCPFSLDGKEHWILALSYAAHIVLARPAIR